jgi:hypothetical protein
MWLIDPGRPDTGIHPDAANSRDRAKAVASHRGLQQPPCSGSCRSRTFESPSVNRGLVKLARCAPCDVDSCHRPFGRLQSVSWPLVAGLRLCLPAPRDAAVAQAGLDRPSHLEPTCPIALACTDTPLLPSKRFAATTAEPRSGKMTRRHSRPSIASLANRPHSSAARLNICSHCRRADRTPESTSSPPVSTAIERATRLASLSHRTHIAKGFNDARHRVDG